MDSLTFPSQFDLLDWSALDKETPSRRALTRTSSWPEMEQSTSKRGGLGSGNNKNTDILNIASSFTDPVHDMEPLRPPCLPTDGLPACPLQGPLPVAAEAVMQVPSQLSEDPPLEPPSMNDDTRDAAACNSSPSPKDRSKTECHPECAENLELEDSSQRVESSLSVEQQADPTTAPQNQEACIQEFDNASQLLAMVPQEMPLVRSMQSSQSGGAAGSVLENALGRRDLEDALSRIESHIQMEQAARRKAEEALAQALRQPAPLQEEQRGAPPALSPMHADGSGLLVPNVDSVLAELWTGREELRKARIAVDAADDLLQRLFSTLNSDSYTSRRADHPSSVFTRYQDASQCDSLVETPSSASEGSGYGHSVGLGVHDSATDASAQIDASLSSSSGPMTWTMDHATHGPGTAVPIKSLHPSKKIQQGRQGISCREDGGGGGGSSLRKGRGAAATATPPAPQKSSSRKKEQSEERTERKKEPWQGRVGGVATPRPVRGRAAAVDSSR